MNRLLEFLYEHRVNFYFIFLLAVSGWIIIYSNSFYNATFFNSSNALAGNFQDFSANSRDYFRLREINYQLALENAKLRKELAEASFSSGIKTELDIGFEAIPGKIINKTYLRNRNYLTLAVGAKDGVKPGMGVLSGAGIVGRVQSTSKNFCTVTSILNPVVMISAQVRRTKILCSAQWIQKDARKIDIRFIPRHVHLEKGDTIETSGYNSVYPPEVTIGIVDSVSLAEEAPFYYATASLGVDFSSLEFAYVISNQKKFEIDSLENGLNLAP